MCKKTKQKYHSTQAKEKRPSFQENQGPNIRRIMPKAQTIDASGQNTKTGEV
jgi:hypothetical protein